MNEYRYTVDENNDGYDDAYVIRQRSKVKFDDELDIEFLAKDCSDDYFRNHSGWDYRSWTNGNTHIDLTIWEDENTKHTFEVYVEYEPYFRTRKKS